MSDADPIIPVPYVPPSNMQDYWQETIGPLYHPIKWNPRWATHPIRVREVMKKLKAGEPCPEGCDVIVGLIHSMSLSENIQRELSNVILELEEAKTARAAADAEAVRKPSTDDLFAVCGAIEAAHEPEQIAVAKAALETWGLTYEQGIDELTRRGAPPTTMGGCEIENGIDTRIPPAV